MTTLLAADGQTRLSSTNTWLDILKKYGIATLFACVLLWFLLSVVIGKLDANGEKTDAVQAAIDAHARDMHVDRAEQKAFQERMLRATIAGCRLQAETARERELCGEAPR